MNHVGPQFSIIIPTCNRASQLTACLLSLHRLAPPPGGFEVILVDDSGLPATPPAAEFDAGTLDLCWIRLPENRGPAAARNAGAAIARGRFLAFLDDDCVPGEAWLLQLLLALESTLDCAVGGKVINGAVRNVFAAANQAILDEVYAYYNSDASHARFFASMNLAVPAAAFRELGGFDPSFRTAEDRDFCARWLARGLRLVFAEQACVAHNAAPSYREFWGRHYRFGIGAFRFRQLHTLPAQGRAALEPAHFYRRLLTSPLRSSLRPAAFLLAALCGLSQVASSFGYWTARRGRAQRRLM